jgi:hypothetical protein
MIKHILSERDLTFSGDGKCAHGKPQFPRNVRQNSLTFKVNRKA